MFRCPGQDQRFWKPDDIFEVKCPACGAAVEFWKDDPKVKCRKCDHVVTNPRLDMGCAKWCRYAKECLGITDHSNAGILQARLVEDAKAELADDQKTVRSMLKALEYSEKILDEEGGDALVVKAATILCPLAECPEEGGLSDRDHAKVRELLVRHGVQAETLEQICGIIGGYITGREVGTRESDIVCDSLRLASLCGQSAKAEGKERILGRFSTVSGSRLAADLL